MQTIVAVAQALAKTKEDPALRKKGATIQSTHGQILKDVCGYTMEEILALKAEGVAW